MKDKDVTIHGITMKLSDAVAKGLAVLDDSEQGYRVVSSSEQTAPLPSGAVATGDSADATVRINH